MRNIPGIYKINETKSMIRHINTTISLYENKKDV
jgi:hypothetical protein